MSVLMSLDSRFLVPKGAFKQSSLPFFFYFIEKSHENVFTYRFFTGSDEHNFFFNMEIKFYNVQASAVILPGLCHFNYTFILPTFKTISNQTRIEFR